MTEHIEQLRDAWRRYGESATMTDGHTRECRARHSLAVCTCGFAAVESAIRALIK